MLKRVLLLSSLSLKVFGADPMTCEKDSCDIDYNGAKRLNLTVPHGTKKATVSYNGSGRLSVNAADNSPLDELRVDSVGSALLDLSKLPAKKVKVKYRGSADLNIHVTESGDIENRGSGDINVEGSGKCSIKNSGSGRVNLPK